MAGFYARGNNADNAPAWGVGTSWQGSWERGFLNNQDAAWTYTGYIYAKTNTISLCGIVDDNMQVKINGNWIANAAPTNPTYNTYATGIVSVTPGWVPIQITFWSSNGGGAGAYNSILPYQVGQNADGGMTTPGSDFQVNEPGIAGSSADANSVLGINPGSGLSFPAGTQQASSLLFVAAIPQNTFANSMSVSGNSTLDMATATASLPFGFGPLSFAATGTNTLNVINGPGEADFASTTITSTPIFNLSAGNVLNLGTVSGNGGFVETGSGTLILPNANSYSGVTNISGGTLQLGNGGATGDLGNSSVINNGTLAFNRSDTALNLSTVIGGNGSVANIGTGTVTLSASNNYSGGTVVNAGALTAANNAAFGTGVLTVNASATANFITASPTVGGLSGVGNVVLGNSPSTVTNLTVNGASSTFSGSISEAAVGLGKLTKAGPNTLTLTGANTYTGGTTISNGVLVANANSLGTAKSTSPVARSSPHCPPPV